LLLQSDPLLWSSDRSLNTSPGQLRRYAFSPNLEDRCSLRRRKHLQFVTFFASVLLVRQISTRPDNAWRKSRLAARLLIRKESRRLSAREQIVARGLSRDPEVTNRLIQQALYFFGIGPRKHAFDRKLVGPRN